MLVYLGFLNGLDDNDYYVFEKEYKSCSHNYSHIIIYMTKVIKMVVISVYI
jgi:hypothetical protein